MTGIPEQVTKEMGLTVADFLRTITRVVDSQSLDLGNNRVTIGGGSRRVEIDLVPRPVRKLGPTVRVSVTQVRISFAGYSAEERAEFMTRFERHFLRAGG